jgi:hypothetical protein
LTPLPPPWPSLIAPASHRPSAQAGRGHHYRNRPASLRPDAPAPAACVAARMSLRLLLAEEDCSMCSSMLPGRARGAVERHARGLCFAAHGASNKRGLNRRSIVLAQGGAVKQQADATFDADAWHVEVRLAALARSDQKAQERANSTPVGKRRPWWWRRWPDERRRPRIPVKMPTRRTIAKPPTITAHITKVKKYGRSLLET